MYCKGCGKAFTDDVEFCSNCGMLITRNDENYFWRLVDFIRVLIRNPIAAIRNSENISIDIILGLALLMVTMKFISYSLFAYKTFRSMQVNWGFMHFLFSLIIEGCVIFYICRFVYKEELNISKIINVLVLVSFIACIVNLFGAILGLIHIYIYYISITMTILTKLLFLYEGIGIFTGESDNKVMFIILISKFFTYTIAYLTKTLII